MLYWLHVTGHSGLVFAPFLFSGLAALLGFSSEREFLPCVIQVQKKVRLKNTLGVEGSEVCGAHFFVREPTLHQLSGKLYLSPGWSFTLLYRAPQFRGAKFLRIALRGPWMFFSSSLFPGLVGPCQQRIDYMNWIWNSLKSHLKDWRYDAVE